MCGPSIFFAKLPSLGSLGHLQEHQGLSLMLFAASATRPCKAIHAVLVIDIDRVTTLSCRFESFSGLVLDCKYIFIRHTRAKSFQPALKMLFESDSSKSWAHGHFRSQVDTNGLSP